MDKRQLCYDTLCNLKKTQDDDGKWIWVIDTNAVLNSNIAPPKSFSAPK